MSFCSPPLRRTCDEWPSGYVHRHQELPSEPHRCQTAKRLSEKASQSRQQPKNHRIRCVPSENPAKISFFSTEFFNGIGRSATLTVTGQERIDRDCCCH